jgi:hypothetical protein
MLWKHKKCYQETNEDSIDPVPVCRLTTFASLFEQNIVFEYVSCAGASSNITLNDSSSTICVQSYTNPALLSNQWSITFVDVC